MKEKSKDFLTPSLLGHLDMVRKLFPVVLMAIFESLPKENHVWGSTFHFTIIRLSIHLFVGQSFLNTKMQYNYQRHFS